jgi:hypothetical protein
MADAEPGASGLLFSGHRGREGSLYRLRARVRRHPASSNQGSYFSARVVPEKAHAADPPNTASNRGS